MEKNDITIIHRDVKLYETLKKALQERGFTASHDSPGKLGVIVVVTNQLFESPDHIQKLEMAINADVYIQPVVHVRDKLRRSELVALAPDCLRSLGDIEWIALDENTWKGGENAWNEGFRQLVLPFERRDRHTKDKKQFENAVDSARRRMLNAHSALLKFTKVGDSERVLTDGLKMKILAESLSSGAETFLSLIGDLKLNRALRLQQERLDQGEDDD